MGPPVSTTMRAFVLTGHGGLDKLVFEDEWPVPELQPSEVLIRVSACGLNNTDINTRTAWYTKDGPGGLRAGNGGGGDEGGWRAGVEFPRIQGGDVCGHVVAVGPDVDDGLQGRRVLIDPWLRDWSAPDDLDRCGVLGSERDGGLADYVSIPAENVHPVESNLSDVELASFPMASITAANMLDRANIVEGDLVLITGASGGVGSALVQLTRSKGATPIAICSPDKADMVAGLGAAAVVSRDEPDLRAALQATIGRETVDAVMDVVGGAGWPRLMEVLPRRGRYCCSGAVAGPVVELDLRTLYLKDLTFTGATITPPHLFAELVSLIERGHLTPVVAATFPLEELQAAQEMFSAKRYVGNLVIDLDRERTAR